MAATINGIVFHDLNHNGQYDAGEPGIPGVAVILYRNAAGCVLVQTGPDGTYSFTARVPSAAFDPRRENNEASLVTPVEQHP